MIIIVETTFFFKLLLPIKKNFCVHIPHVEGKTMDLLKRVFVWVSDTQRREMGGEKKKKNLFYTCR